MSDKPNEELKELKKKADEMGVQYSPNIGPEKLKERIAEAEKPKEYVTKSDLESFGQSITDKIVHIFTPKRMQEMHTDGLRQGQPMSLSEIRTEGAKGVELASENDLFPDAIALEKFMNEEVVIEVQSEVEEGDLEIISPNVNGVNQPIPRGVPVKVKRKYVEALARCRLTTYDQKQKDAHDPTSLDMVPRTRLAYPFTVQDNDPKGRIWLKNLLAEAN